MSDIVILDELPVVLTKEVWEPKRPVKAGSILRLPSDAVLVIAQESKDG
jgi:hypothetical protein